jgi:WD40 repeat protein/serine/threonine protein kinase
LLKKSLFLRGSTALFRTYIQDTTGGKRVMNTLNVVESIFFAALEKESSEGRAAYLAEACKDDAELRRCVERLLSAHARADGVIPSQAPGLTDTRESPPIAERPGTVVGPYKLLQELGEGGFGVVFMAEQEQPVRRKVAFKIIKPGMDSKQVVARFEAERQALALMHNPNIARVLDGGTTQSGRPYFVMELVKGVSITEFCDKNRLTPRERLELFTPVCQAVQHAHQKGIIHRDLKPSNVLVTMYDDKPVPKVIDFGVSKAIEQKLTEQTLFTRIGQVIGTLEYMSPEQASLSALDVDTRADIYALGVLLYELLTGTTPLSKDRLQGVAFLEMLRLIREEDPPRPSTRLTQSREALAAFAMYRRTETQKLPTLVKGDLDWIAMKALEKDRTRRYETANALAADVQRYLKDEPVEACPPTVGYRMQKYVRRHKAFMSAMSAVAALLLIGIVTTSWQAVRAMRAEEEARRELRSKELARKGEQEQRALAVAKAAAADEERQKANLEKKNAERARQDADAQRKIAEWALYPFGIASAQSAWESNDMPRFYHFLELCRPDFRGFEHNYLYTLANQDQHTLRGHTAPVHSLAFSPDGKRVASGSAPGVVWGPPGELKLWDVASGRELLTFQGDPEPILCVAFSPDGRFLASASRGTAAMGGNKSRSGAVKLWDAFTGKEIWSLPTRVCRSVAFSPDGKWLACARREGPSAKDSTDRLSLLEAASGKELLVLQGGNDLVDGVAFSPDGRRLACAMGSAKVKLWELASGQVYKVLKGHKERVWDIAFSPDGKRLASASSDKTVKLWDVDGGSEVLTFSEHTGQVKSVAYSPDGKRLASAAEDNTVKVWNAASGKEVETLKGHREATRGIASNRVGVNSVAFSPDGKHLASGSEDGTVKLWDAVNLQATKGITILSNRVWGMAFSPDGKRLAGALSDKTGTTVKVWDAASGQEVLILKGRASIVGSVAFSPDGKRLASAFHDETVKVWDAATGQKIRTFKGPRSEVNVVAFSPNGERLANSLDQTVKVWDVASGQLILTLDTRHADYVLSVAFSPDGKRLATASKDQTVKLWDAVTGQELRTLKGHTEGVQSVVFSPDGKRLASASGALTGGADVKLWDAASGREVLTLKGLTAQVTDIAFGADGKRLAATLADKTVKLWDLSSGQEVLTLKLKNETGSPRNNGSVAFSPDGKRLASSDGTGIIIWDASKSMKELEQK